MKLQPKRMRHTPQAKNRQMSDPATQSMAAELGPASPTFDDAIRVLQGLYREVQDQPDVAVRFREWQSRLTSVYGEPVGGEELFVKHTYLAILARLIAFRAIQPGSSPPGRETLVKILNGDFFRERDIYNFADVDLFTWTLNSKAREGFLELAAELANTLTAYDFTNTGVDLLTTLYQEIAGPPGLHEQETYCASDEVASQLLSGELKLQDTPELRVLDPACGSGTLLNTAIRLIREEMRSKGQDDLDTLLHIQDSVMGMDADPVAVAVARTSYLLALGDLVRGPHLPVLVPVYLADSLQLPETATTESQGSQEEPVYQVHTSEPGIVFELPDSLVDDPINLDWVVQRLDQYLHAARFRAGQEGEERATNEVISSLYSYLTSPKRGSLRQLPPLSPFAADVLCRTTGTLIRLTLQGKDTVWLHILSNAPAPLFFSRRKFDLVVSCPHWRCAGPVTETATSSLGRWAQFYVRDGGAIALVVPGATAEDLGRALHSFPSESGPPTLRMESTVQLAQPEGHLSAFVVRVR